MSRIRRTTTSQVLLMEALLVYASFLVLTWYMDRELLITELGLLRLAIPAAITLSLITLQAAWDPAFRSAIARVVFFFSLVLYSWCLAALVPWLPSRVSRYGFYAGIILSSTVRLLYQSGEDRAQPATRPNFRAEAASYPRDTKGWLALGAAIMLGAISMALRPGIEGAFIAFIITIVFELTRLRKE